MKKIILIMVLAVITIPLSAQNSIEGILSSIEQNNTTLKAMGDQAQADKLENRTGIFLANPEVEFNRLWGNPGTIGNRNDINVSQSFDIPTITGMKSRQANLFPLHTSYAVDEDVILVLCLCHLFTPIFIPFSF